MRTTTADLFPAVLAAEVVSLQVLLDRCRGLPLEVALDIGAALAEHVGAVHAAGRLMGRLDASRVRVSRQGRVTLAREGGALLAPELLQGRAASVQSDVYAVAHLVYQLLTDRTPAEARRSAAAGIGGLLPPPSQFNSRVDPELDQVILAALRSEPSDRPASVLALQASIDGLFEEGGVVPSPEALGARVVGVLEWSPLAPRASWPASAIATSSFQTTPVPAAELLEPPSWRFTAPTMRGLASAKPAPLLTLPVNAEAKGSRELVDVGEAWLASPGEHSELDEGEPELAAPAHSLLDAPWMPYVLGALVLTLSGLLWATSPTVAAPELLQPVLAPAPLIAPPPSVVVQPPARSVKKASVRRHR
jgi:hypothetical protein